MDDYEITRAAVEVRRVEKTPEAIEIEAIERQKGRFFWLSIATMVVSFIHMVGALVLFSDGTLIGGAAAFLMTGLVDAATWVVTGYYDYAKRRKLKRGKLVATLLVVALIISCGLNLAYLIQHMPASLPGVVGWLIALAFAAFIPLCIAVASAERGQLEDDKTQILQAMPAATTPSGHNVVTTLPIGPVIVAEIRRPPPSLLLPRSRHHYLLPAPRPEAAIGPFVTDKYAATIVAMREATTPPTSFATIGKHLGISGEAVRQKYYAAIADRK